jgi:hypothetical protein
MQTVAKTLDLGVSIMDTLVVLKEYDLLHEAINTGYLRNERGIVVMGHPGIGSSRGLFGLQVEY